MTQYAYRLLGQNTVTLCIDMAQYAYRLLGQNTVTLCIDMAQYAYWLLGQNTITLCSDMAQYAYRLSFRYFILLQGEATIHWPSDVCSAVRKSVQSAWL
jgi:hypothetical protein